MQALFFALSRSVKKSDILRMNRRIHLRIGVDECEHKSDEDLMSLDEKGKGLEMDRAEIVDCRTSESLVFGRKLHLPSIWPKNRNIHYCWNKNKRTQLGSIKKALNMASLPLKNVNLNKRREGCPNPGFRLMRMILS